MDKKDFEKYMSPSGAEVSIIPVINEDEVDKKEEIVLPENVPVLALRNAVLFPESIFPITIGREKSAALIKDMEASNGVFAAVPQNEIMVEDPEQEDLFEYGTVAKLLKTLQLPDGTLTAIVRGVKRVRIDELTSTEPYLRANVTYLEDFLHEDDSNEIKGLEASLKERAEFIIKASSLTPHKEAVEALRSIDDFSFLVNFIATTSEIDNFIDKVNLLQHGNLKVRAMELLMVLDTQIQLIKIKQDINQKVKKDIDQQQREYYLNNQLKTIQEELGMDADGEFEQMRKKAAKKDWPKYVAKAFEKEIAKLERFNPSSPDYSVQYNYIEFLLALPWNKVTKDNLDIKHAKKVLDQDHFGLDKVKDRIIEYLAVLKLKGDMKSPILCLYGPPGVGKTSLGKSMARSLGREYVRISLGGMHDEAEIRGHRKTYVGALPGRILKGIAKCGSSNPVIVLDEIDKLGSDFKGDPASALLEVLDPEQNSTFHDNYLDLDYDLSNVLFLTTANDVSTISTALKDRMEMINVTGYLEEEKVEIAKRYLLPKQLKNHGIDGRSLKISKSALEKIVSEYTSESGVRGLEKRIAKIARVTAKKIALEEERVTTIKPENLKEYLGLPISQHDKQQGNEAPGVVTGLAWTQVGGEILFIETLVSEGKGGLTMTGNLGDVMKESIHIGYQYIKAHPELANLTAKEFAKKDIHVHVPEGAVPKDGPSAGITIVSSMISALRNEKIKSKVAMTGEMTLRGRVLPVGGIKEKILAAKRAGVNTILISEENRKDIEDIKEIYVKGLSFVYLKNINDVVSYIF